MENNNHAFSREFPANVSEVENVINFIVDSVNFLSLPAKVENYIRICVEEVFVNIASYAYDGEGIAIVSVAVIGDRIIMTFADNGQPFNPLAKDDPNILAGADERRIGGLGIFMVKKMMDDVYYNYEQNKNILTLVKIVEAAK